MDDFDQLADFYDVDYADSSDHGFLTRLASAADPEHLLEIPCGAGRNVVPLLEATSRNVTFADRAQTMVDETAKRIAPSERRRARAVVANMTELGRRSEFDLVICPREAFQLLSPPDAARALESLGSSLADDGVLVVDLFDFGDGPASPADAPPDYFAPQDHDWVEAWTRADAARELTVTRRRRQTRTGGGVHFELHYAVRGPAGRPLRAVDLEFDMTSYRGDELRELARRSGLEVLAALAGYGPAAVGAPATRRTVYLLGRGRSQQGRDRVERICRQVGADRSAPDGK
jgi:SAM-dependent methyltransferase